MNKINSVELFAESKADLEEFSQRFCQLHLAFQSMYESKEDLTEADRADIVDYKKDQDLFESFLNKHGAYDKEFKEGVLKGEIELKDYDKWFSLLQNAFLLFRACNVNVSAIKHDVVAPKNEPKDYVQIGNMKIVLRSYISKSFDRFKVEEKKEEVELEQECE